MYVSLSFVENVSEKGSVELISFGAFPTLIIGMVASDT
jgi:hypothetical protein